MSARTLELAGGRKILRGRRDGVRRGVSTYAIEDTLIAGVFQSGVWVKLVWNTDGVTQFIADAPTTSLGYFHVSGITQPGWYTVWVSSDNQASWQSTGRTSYLVGPVDSTGGIPESSIENLAGDLAARPLAESEVSLSNWTPADYGWLGWTFDPVGWAAGLVAATAGLVYFQRIKLRRAHAVTGVLYQLNAFGVTLTAGQNFAGLYGADLALKGVSADQSANWTSGIGVKAIPFAGGPVNMPAGDCFAAFVFNGTTGPSFGRGGNSAIVNGLLAAANARFGTANAAQTALPAALSGLTLATFPYWAGIY